MCFIVLTVARSTSEVGHVLHCFLCFLAAFGGHVFLACRRATLGQGLHVPAGLVKLQTLA